MKIKRRNAINFIHMSADALETYVKVFRTSVSGLFDVRISCEGDHKLDHEIHNFFTGSVSCQKKLNFATYLLSFVVPIFTRERSQHEIELC